MPPFHGLIADVQALQFLFANPFPFIWFVGKVAAVFYIYLWLRATFPRYRYDQLMRIGWKWLIPLSLFHVLYVGVLLVLMKWWGLSAGWAIVGAAVEILLILITLFIERELTDRKDEKEAWRPAY